jgi:hypothetical protein
MAQAWLRLPLLPWPRQACRPRLPALPEHRSPCLAFSRGTVLRVCYVSPSHVRSLESACCHAAWFASLHVICSFLPVSVFVPTLARSVKPQHCAVRPRIQSYTHGTSSLPHDHVYAAWQNPCKSCDTNTVQRMPSITRLNTRLCLVHHVHAVGRQREVCTSVSQQQSAETQGIIL